MSQNVICSSLINEGVLAYKMMPNRNQETYPWAENKAMSLCLTKDLSPSSMRPSEI